MMRATILSLLVFISLCTQSFAVNPNERLADPELEERARIISKDLRCMVCQNQSIDDSDAELAGDLRVLVRERLQKGDSNEEVFDFVVERYGEFVLLSPRFGLHTALLWSLPIFLLIAGLWLSKGLFSRQQVQDELSAEEAKALADLQRSQN